MKRSANAAGPALFVQLVGNRQRLGVGLDEVGESVHEFGPLVHGCLTPGLKSGDRCGDGSVGGCGVASGDVGQVQTVPVERRTGLERGGRSNPLVGDQMPGSDRYAIDIGSQVVSHDRTLVEAKSFGTE